MSYTVTLSRSGRSFHCETHESVLDAALRQGLSIPYGCRHGGCGSCRARLQAGAIDYPAGEPGGLDARQRARGDVLLCQARAVSDLQLDVDELDVGRVTAVRTLPVRVVQLQQLAHDVMEVRLRLPASERLQYLAGQYVEVLLRDGRRRAFSLANAPHDDDTLQLHVRRVPGGVFSEHVFEGLRERALLRIHGPLGAFFLRDDDPRPAILVAGGTGFAPIKAMVEGAMAAAPGRRLTVYWGVRARRDLYLDALARGWAERDEIDYVPVLSEPAGADDWHGRTGFVHAAVLADHPDLSGVQVYASGPPVMVRALRDSFLEHGLDAGRLHYDSFEYAFETGYDE